MAFRKPITIYKSEETRVYINQCHAPGRKTYIFTVRRDDKTGMAHLIGTISWWGAWRQYVFFPGPDTLWAVSCLDGITKFLKEINKQHREKLMKRRRGNG